MITVTLEKGQTFEIPAEIWFPGGYMVRVVRRDNRSINSSCGKARACWHSDRQTIYLRTTRRGRALVNDFLHEMQHVVLDWAYAMSLEK